MGSVPSFFYSDKYYIICKVIAVVWEATHSASLLLKDKGSFFEI